MEMFRSNVSEQQYQTWFSPMRVKQYDAAKKELTVFTPSQFFFEYLEEHFRRLIHITISRISVLTVSYSCRNHSTLFRSRHTGCIPTRCGWTSPGILCCAYSFAGLLPWWCRT